MKANLSILFRNVDTYIKENEDKLVHYKSAYWPMSANTSQSLMQYFFYNDLILTYEYTKIAWKIKL